MKMAAAFPIPLLTALVLTCVATAEAVNVTAWSLSTSPMDPLANEADTEAGEGTLYLWLVCAPGTGVTAAKLQLGGTLIPTAFVPLGGLLNRGTHTDLDLVSGSCIRGPALVGAILFRRDGPGYLAIGDDASPPSIAGCLGEELSGPHGALAYADRVGDSVAYSTPGPLCPNTATSASSWGDIKDSYRSVTRLYR